jgi:hypothetical protein
LNADILRIKNVLPAEQHEIILRSVQSELFPWNLIRDIGGNGNTSDDITQYAFRHRLWWQNSKVSEWANLFDPLLSAMTEQLDGSLIYVPKIFLNMNMNYGAQNGNLSHCDGFMEMETQTQKRYTAVYYLNDSDGDTLFYSDDRETVIGSSTPQSNTMIIFPSAVFHSRQLPLINNTRLVLNINVLMDKHEN